MKQLEAVGRGSYGRTSTLIHTLARNALEHLTALGDARDDVRRAAERIAEFTEVRPEHERALVVVCRPRAPGGLPAVEVYSDRRVFVKLTFDDERLPWNWQQFKDSITYPEVFCLPQWIYEP